MSFTSLLNSTCTIQRYVAGAADAYGVPAKAWADHLVAQPCRLSYPKGKQLQTATEVVPITEMLFMAVVDVTEHDRVVVGGNTYDILFVATRQDGPGAHHMELDLRRVIP